MDLWDVAKLLWRRRWISIPLVVLTIGAASYVSATMSPDYKATGHMTLLPPTESKPVQPNSVVSPWTVWSLSDALIIYSGRADVHSEFVSSGLSEAWTVEVAGTTLPILQIEAVAPDPELANATLDRLVDVLTAQLASLQEPYGASGQSAITAKALDVGQNSQVVTSKVKRTVVVVVAIGLVLSAAATMLIDALLRRRRNRGSAVELADAMPLSPAVAPSPPSAGPEPAERPAAQGDETSQLPASTAQAEAKDDSTLMLPLAGLRLGTYRRRRSMTSGSGQD